jgi:5-hydroxyisourate hydrolase
MSPITTHVLDTTRGRPASGLLITLERQAETSEPTGKGEARSPSGGGKEHWTELARGTTDADGRLKDLLPEDKNLETGLYRLTFATGDYFRLQSAHGFYPYVTIVFEVKDERQHYHVPLLLSPFGYSTYRGS